MLSFHSHGRAAQHIASCPPTCHSTYTATFTCSARRPAKSRGTVVAAVRSPSDACARSATPPSHSCARTHVALTVRAGVRAPHTRARARPQKHGAHRSAVFANLCTAECRRHRGSRHRWCHRVWHFPRRLHPDDSNHLQAAAATICRCALPQLCLATCRRSTPRGRIQYFVWIHATVTSRLLATGRIPNTNCRAVCTVHTGLGRILVSMTWWQCRGTG